MGTPKEMEGIPGKLLGYRRRVRVRIPIEGLELDGDALCPADLQGMAFKSRVNKISSSWEIPENAPRSITAPEPKRTGRLLTGLSGVSPERATSRAMNQSGRVNCAAVRAPPSPRLLLDRSHRPESSRKISVGQSFHEATKTAQAARLSMAFPQQ